MRRCLGPVGGSVAFLLVAGLVFAGLGWVTVAALRVEDAQRAAAAEAAVANNLRVALWRLDGRLLPALGAENARPYLEYEAPDPDSAYGPTCAQLLAAPLPDWMKLHAQLDPETGWASPQVLTPDARLRFEEAWPELTPTNATPDRARALDALRRRHAAKVAYAAFARHDGIPVPTDRGRPVADAAPAKMMAPPAFGLANGPAVPELARPKEDERVAPAPKAVDPAGVAPAPPPRPAPVAADNTARNGEFDANRGDLQFRRRVADLAADARQQQTYIYPPNYRQNTTDPLTQNGLANNFARNTVPVNPGQNPPGQPGLGGILNRYAAPPGPADRDSRSGTKADENGATAMAQMAKGAGPGGGPRALEGGARAEAPSLGGLVDFLARGLKESQQKYKLQDQDGAKAKGATDGLAMLDRAKAERMFATPGASGGGGFGRGGVAGGAPAPAPPPGVAGPFPKAAAGAESPSRSGPALPLAGRLPVPDLKAVPPGGPPAGGTAPAAPASASAPAPPTPTPVVPPTAPETAPRAPAAEPAPPADAPAPPVVLFNVPPVAVHLGPVRPQWLPAGDGGPDSLVLVRTARLNDRTVYQGVVLDWPGLQKVLREDVQDLFPHAQLVPVKAGDATPDRAMTALPVQLDPGPPAATDEPAEWSPLRIGLALAWAAALIAFGAIGLAGWSLIDLSERRIRFVSAVTHELRTPLTSLRLYLDLLLSGMVQDEAKRTEYLATLAVESDRLHRLVDNVLDFARLERRRASSDLKPAKVADVLAAVRDTWTDRCGADGKELIVVSTLPPEAEVTTDAALVGQIVGNLIDNARKYTRTASDPRVWVWAKPEGRKVVFEVEDRGPGVPPREQKLIFRPFRRGETADTTAGGAGLGLALCKQWAESLGGTLGYRPADGDTGACFRLELPGK
ncbi:sensor histidine kinase [Urbifossiella limnaea]|uniref:histidine kinase n=1 Tax=Urbifossiella limnaea TaxID=2528023 RepID=A0A517Y073_9BACT|nr:HAMP domain-containing sensor histidine kinase [Urbifossiella limnaea]QDU23155.1 Autoinducer 2 sensor kinase/phosphatase LuxQ [Urbifossiella limnaea]